MTRTEAEQALLDLINTSAIRQSLATDVDILDAEKFGADSQLLIDPPFILMRPLRFEYVGENKRPGDIYGTTYGDTDFYVGFLIGARNYRSPQDRLHGGVGDVGVNELLSGLEELLRGVNLSTSNRAPGVPRVFLVKSESEEDAEGVTVYSLTVRVVGLILE